MFTKLEKAIQTGEKHIQPISLYDKIIIEFPTAEKKKLFLPRGQNKLNNETRQLSQVTTFTLYH
jgi:hypothetical protein